MINVFRGIGFIAAVVYFLCQFTSLGDNEVIEKGAFAAAEKKGLSHDFVVWGLNPYD